MPEEDREKNEGGASSLTPEEINGRERKRSGAGKRLFFRPKLFSESASE